MASVTINGIGLFEKTAEVFKEMLEDSRINESVRNEYRERITASIDEWAAEQKAPENRAMGLVMERKHDLCSECGYYRPLRYKPEEKLYLCELCY